MQENPELNEHEESIIKQDIDTLVVRSTTEKLKDPADIKYKPKSKLF